MANERIRDFYDRFSTSQQIAGVNERHRLILSLAVQHGVSKAASILEIGCGIGTFTGLLARKVERSRILAVDISPASVAAAQERLKGRRNLEMRVMDVVTDPLPGKFDMIVLPDVLEHIPEGDRPALFKKMAAALNTDGKILVHSPDPDHLQFLKDHHPDKLQVIDIPLHLRTIVPEFEAAGLRMSFFQRHAIWNGSPDYMAFVLVHAIAGSHS